jgi:DNA topoisomerase-1
MDEITLEDALELFKLPRTLGHMPDGHAIKVAVGRFGPYVQYGAKKYVSLKQNDDPYTITLERAHELIVEKQQIEANRIIREFEGTDVRVLNGRFGPYVTDGRKNGKIPKDRDPKSLTLEECQALLAAAPARTSRWGKKAAPAQAPAEGEATATAIGTGSAPGKKQASTKKNATSAKKSAARTKAATARKGAARTQG